jgi:hypothetical protein
MRGEMFEAGEIYMRMGSLAVGLLLVVAICSQVVPVQARERRSGSSEVRIEQARGNLPAGAAAADVRAKPVKGAPEGGANSGATAPGSSAPVTCNQQNASSPACYSATQQGRPVTK